ncbi:MAG: 2-methylaconitate cis-trans isomerase PrpF family protein [Thalassobaculaceae bacterium]
MTQARVAAVFMRGGSSKGVFFHASDLPIDRLEWDRIFMSAIGSPDPYGRQLNGMGGGISSLSKAVVIGPASRPDTDLDYTFAQVAVKEELVDYSSNCGNLSSAVGPFAIDTGLIKADETSKIILIHNTNSKKIIRATIPTKDGFAQVNGNFKIPGVSGTGAQIRLDFLEPGGTKTGSLLPTGNPTDTISIKSAGDFEVSLIDSSVPCAFVAAERFGLTGAETIEELERNLELMDLVELIRLESGVKMGLAKSITEVPATAPKLGIVSKSSSYRTLAGEVINPSSADVTARIWSMGQVHRVLPLTGAMCLAIACRVPGTICNDIVADGEGDVRISNPSGILPLDAKVVIKNATPFALQVTAYRTARTLMEGNVLIPNTSDYLQ